MTTIGPVPPKVVDREKARTAFGKVNQLIDAVSDVKTAVEQSTPDKLISTQADNALEVGADNKLFVPDTVISDPLAWYILAKS